MKKEREKEKKKKVYELKRGVMKEEAKKILTKDLSEHKLQVESSEEEKNYK